MTTPLSPVACRSPELKLDRPSEQAFINFYKTLPEKPEGTFRFFERPGGESYTTHGEDANQVAKLVFKTTTVIKYLGGDASRGLETCNVPKAAAEAFMREHLKSGRLEIWTCDGRQDSWHCDKKASPGNFSEVESLLFENIEAPFTSIIIAISLLQDKEGTKIGASFIDSTAQHIGVTEFFDNEIFSNLESLLVQTGARECLLPTIKDDLTASKLSQALTRCDVMVTPVANSGFSATNIEQNIRKLVKTEEENQVIIELELTLAMRATACLISYLSLLDQPSNLGSYVLSRHDLMEYMRLDGSALQALNLMPESKQATKSVSMSLYGLLNHCRTTQGSRLLNQWLKQPLTQLKAIDERLNLVSALVEDGDLRSDLRDKYLRRMPDLLRLCKKFRAGRAKLQDVVRVYQMILVFPDLIQSLNDSPFSDLLRSIYTQNIEDCYEGLVKLKELTETTIDLSRVDNHEYIIRSDFDPVLVNLESEKDGVLEELKEEYYRVGQLLRIELGKKLKFEKSSNFGYHLRVSRTDSSCLRPHSKSIIELNALKTGIMFTTGPMKELSDRYRELEEEYSRVQSTFVKEVISIVDTYTHIFDHFNGIVAHLDLISSFAHAAVTSATQYVRPIMSEQDGNEKLILKESRHPCLEAQPTISFIPNDVTMIRGEREFLIITGPNMGGKSTYIRQVGVIALMAQIGSFVPCTEAQLPIFDSILARVGANDSQQKGISTFMAEMIETSSIIKSATSRSLIIVDELGRGTSTNDGFGLAWAISEHISKSVRSMCLFATHFHELTKLSESVPTVANLHVVAHTPESSHPEGSDETENHITLLYQIKEGVCDQSFGIHVARMAGFPEYVIRFAKRKVDELETIEGGLQHGATPALRDGTSPDQEFPTPEESATFMTKAIKLASATSDPRSALAPLLPEAQALARAYPQLPSLPHH